MENKYKSEVDKVRIGISLIMETIEFDEEGEEEEERDGKETYYARNQEERRWVYRTPCTE